jgi:hypothetical protein
MDISHYYVLYRAFTLVSRRMIAARNPALRS